MILVVVVGQRGQDGRLGAGWVHLVFSFASWAGYELYEFSPS